MRTGQLFKNYAMNLALILGIEGCVSFGSSSGVAFVIRTRFQLRQTFRIRTMIEWPQTLRIGTRTAKLQEKIPVAAKTARKDSSGRKNCRKVPVTVRPRVAEQCDVNTQSIKYFSDH
ncbi:hypothetical protein TNCV_3345291 [Trichonephila clavipes]|nr:hypothetical protein TNCV_3345291 [Trichonephila clavipes]